MTTVIAAALSATLTGCSAAVPPAIEANAERGAGLLAQYQCGRCHRIPGIVASPGTLASNLESFGRRSYIAGRIPNEDAALVRWIMDPAAVAPGTLMPDLGVNAADARDMTAYLRRLR